MPETKLISDYAMIGDLQTAALVHRNGSIEWFCAPRFDSSATFCALLGDETNGYWRIAPKTEHAHIKRRYNGDTLVLETDSTTVDGQIRVTDFMPMETSCRTIVRIVEGISGSISCEMTLAPKMRYGTVTPLTTHDDDTWTARVAPHGLVLRTAAKLDEIDGGVRSNFTIRENERAVFVLQAFQAHDAIPEPLDALISLTSTITWWTTWAAALKCDGPHRNILMRSAITLKALSYEPAGSFVAAVTTSLPELIGGSKNWDYRYCWLRDASFAVKALLGVGRVEEAARWRDWFSTVYVKQPAQLHIMYQVDGEALPEARTLSALPGFAASTPIQVSNGAHDQFQLGIYGDVLTAFEHAQKVGLTFSQDDWQTVESLMRHVETVWERPGNGIWETRVGGRQYVDSKLMAWVAIDRGLKIAEHGGFAMDVAHWRALMARMHEQICRAGFDPQRNTFTQYYGSVELDASILMMPLVGFLPADDPRVIGTIAAIEQFLMVDGYVYRYSADDPEDGIPAEGAFTMCGFWLVEVYAAAGRMQEAHALFERLAATANDVGLFSEEFDPRKRMAVGNVPQAFSHAGLISAELSLNATECTADVVHLEM